LKQALWHRIAAMLAGTSRRPRGEPRMGIRRGMLCGGGSVAVVFLLSLGCECAGGLISRASPQAGGRSPGRPKKSDEERISLRENHQDFAQGYQARARPHHVHRGTRSFFLHNVPPTVRANPRFRGFKPKSVVLQRRAPPQIQGLEQDKLVRLSWLAVDQRLDRNPSWHRRTVFEAHRLLYHSAQGSRTF